ncbi:MAG: hypothetical protein JWO90_741 [Solirubrobacterales bacterium]|nr:hypothetical protein [Solirubrobacterales bacterium]
MPEPGATTRIGDGAVAFARMSGSSIAGPDAAAWVTDFLNAAYYRRTTEGRDVDDLRLAFAVLTTYWAREAVGRRLHLVDLPAFHRAFGAARFRGDGGARGTLDRAALLAGASTLLGPWFPEAYADRARRGWGIVFKTPEERAAHDPGRRLALARLGAPTPGQAPREEQTWHTYPPVRVPSSAAVVDQLTRPETWPDHASELGRFTPLRPGGLLGQTFEIEVAAGADAGRPVFTRGYVTITALVTQDDPAALAAWLDEVQDGLARYGEDEPPALPYGADLLVGFDLTTHEGHFMGRGHNRLLLFEHDGEAFVRAVGTWDPMPWHLEQAYRVAGRDAQRAFWGQGGRPEQSMLHQLARNVEGIAVEH